MSDRSVRARRAVAALGALLVAVTLVGAPVTMADWGEQATFSAEPIDASAVHERTPVLQYGDLPENARDAVRRTVESPDRAHTVYGREDWPDRFSYSDNVAPGRGMYAVVYEGQYYRLTTYAGGGFPFVYWLYELPFVVYGVALVSIATRTYRRRLSSRVAAVAAAAGAGFHLLGPAFDFPVFAPGQFVGVGVLAAVAVAITVVRLSRRD